MLEVMGGLPSSSRFDRGAHVNIAYFEYHRNLNARRCLWYGMPLQIIFALLMLIPIGKLVVLLVLTTNELSACEELLTRSGAWSKIHPGNSSPLVYPSRWGHGGRRLTVIPLR